MNARGYDRIPHELCHWITFLCKGLLPSSIGTFIESIGRGHTDTRGLRDRCLVDAEYAQPLDPLLPVVAEGEMILVGADETICSCGGGDTGGRTMQEQFPTPGRSPWPSRPGPCVETPYPVSRRTHGRRLCFPWRCLSLRLPPRRRHRTPLPIPAPWRNGSPPNGRLIR